MPDPYGGRPPTPVVAPPPRGRDPVVPYYAREGEAPPPALEALREQYTNADLARLVRAFGLGKPPMRKDEMVGQLVRLRDGDALRETWAKLAPLEQAAAAETAWSDDGRLDRERFRAKYGRLPG